MLTNFLFIFLILFSFVKSEILSYDGWKIGWSEHEDSMSFNRPGVYGDTSATKHVSDYGSFARPGSRKLFAFGDHKDSFFLFGGLGRDINANFGALNDLWEFSKKINQFRFINTNGDTPSTQQKVNANNEYGRKSMNFENYQWPGARYDSWMTFCNQTNSFFLFSGRSYSPNSVLQDFWELDYEKKYWRHIKYTVSEKQEKIKGEIGIYSEEYEKYNTPGGRYGHRMIDLNEIVVLFGGYGYAEKEIGYLGDLWFYHTEKKQWKFVNPKKNENLTKNVNSFSSLSLFPSARKDYAIWKLRDEIYLFGGFGVIDTSSDKTNQELVQSERESITKEKVESTIKEEIAKKEEVTASKFGKLSDIWKYSSSENEWKLFFQPPTTSGGSWGTTFGEKSFPSLRDAFGFFFEPKINSLLVFGGFGKDSTSSEVTLGDYWEFNLMNKQWRFLPMKSETSVGGRLLSRQFGKAPYSSFSLTQHPGATRDHRLVGSAQIADEKGVRKRLIYLFGGNGAIQGGNGTLSGEFGTLWNFRYSAKEDQGLCGDEFLCSGKGKCTNYTSSCECLEKCQCQTGYFGERCEFWSCFGISSNASNVCNGNGICKKMDMCECKNGFDGKSCREAYCFGISSHSTSVCNSNGICLKDNICKCSKPLITSLDCSCHTPTQCLQNSQISISGEIEGGGFFTSRFGNYPNISQVIFTKTKQRSFISEWIYPETKGFENLFFQIIKFTVSFFLEGLEEHEIQLMEGEPIKIFLVEKKFSKAVGRYQLSKKMIEEIIFIKEPPPTNTNSENSKKKVEIKTKEWNKEKRIMLQYFSNDPHYFEVYQKVGQRENVIPFTISMFQVELQSLTGLLLWITIGLFMFSICSCISVLLTGCCLFIPAYSKLSKEISEKIKWVVGNSELEDLGNLNSVLMSHNKKELHPDSKINVNISLLVDGDELLQQRDERILDLITKE